MTRSYLDTTPTKIMSNGQRKSIYYNRWSNMMDRCYNTDCSSYPNYGGRGIEVCKEWWTIEGYVLSLPHGYFEGAHLDRIDNNGNYEPSNVRWSTAKENMNNRSSTVLLTHNGRTQSMTMWAEKLGVEPSVIWTRLNVWDWSVADAVTRLPLSDPHERMKRAHEFRWKDHTKPPPPPKRVFRTVTFAGNDYTLSELSTLTGISHKSLAKRIFERGWPVEKAIAKG